MLRRPCSTRLTWTAVLVQTLNTMHKLQGWETPEVSLVPYLKLLALTELEGCGFDEKHEPEVSGIRKGALFSAAARMVASAGNRRRTWTDWSIGDGHHSWQLTFSWEPKSKWKIRKIKLCFQYEKEMTTASNHRLKSKSSKTEKLVPMKTKRGQSLAPALADTMKDKNFLKSQYLSLENSTK